MSFDALPAMVADLLQEQRTTNDRLATVCAALAGMLGRAHDAAKVVSSTHTPEAIAVAKSPETAPAKKRVNDALGPVTAKAAEVVAPAKTDNVPPPAVESAADPVQASTVAIEYADVAKAINNVVKTNRDHAVATLQKFGAKRGTELAADQYGAFLAALAEVA